MTERRLTRALAALLCVCVLMCACLPVGLSEAPATDGFITDASGVELRIPPRGADIRIASAYAVAVPFIVALGLQENVVAINCKSRFWTDNVPELGKAGSVGRGVVDLEALAACEPTVLIHRTGDAKTSQAVKELGIDVLCIRAESIEDVAWTLRVMGRYFGREARAEEVIAYMDGKFAMTSAIVADIPPAERPTALVMGGEYGRIAGGDMLQSRMIERAGGVPAAEGITNNGNWTQAGVEKVFELDPDYLFLTSSTPLEYSAEDILTDPVWSALKCVINKRVCQIPSRIDAWDLPGVASVLGTIWMLSRMHPAHMSGEALQREIDEYYTLMFGRSFGGDYLGYEAQ